METNKWGTDRPLAAKGLKSYRYKGHFGFVMIGAKDDADALVQAQRSVYGSVSLDNLEAWNGSAYVAVVS